MEHLRFPKRSPASPIETGGDLVGSVPNAFRLRNRWKFLCGKPFETDPTHYRSIPIARCARNWRPRSRISGSIRSPAMFSRRQHGYSGLHLAAYRIRIYALDLIFVGTPK